MTITALPDAPSRADAPDVFIAKANIFVAALALLVTEMNAAISTANQTKWISGTVYAIGDEVWSPADFQAYRRKTAGAGVTDPSADSTNWQRTEVSATSIQNQTYKAYTTGGSSTAYTLTPSPAVAALAENQEFDVEFHTAAGVTPTLAASGLVAKSLKYRDNSGAKQAVGATQIPAGWRSKVVYDGTDYIVREVPPAAVVTQNLVQVVEAAPIVTVVACATAIPYDDTIPQNTEGVEVITVSITPTSATNRLRVEFDAGQASINGTGRVMSALFQDATANALAATSESFGATTYDSFSLRLSHEMVAGTVAATTFKIRVGATSGSVAYVNSNNGGSRIFGGVAAARLRVTEIKV